MKLKCDDPLSNFAFNFNLRRCSAVSTGFVGYHMLVSACRCVNVYGFNTSVGGHYWDVKHRADKSHRMGPEHDVMVSTCT